MNIVYIRQQSCFSSDSSNGREWREEIQIKTLAKENNVTWVSSDFDHYAKSKRSQPKLNIKNVEILLLKSFAYKKNISFSRVLSNLLFSINLVFFLVKNLNKFDLVICAYPTPESAFISSLFSKLFSKKCIIDVRDKWPDAFIEKEKSLLAPIFKIYCDFLNFFIFNFSSSQICMSDSMMNFAERYSKKTKKITVLNNISFIHNPMNDNKAPSLKLVFYGSINNQFSFDELVNLSNEAEIKYPNLKIYIIGDGEMLGEVKNKFKESKNIIFKAKMSFRDLKDFCKDANGYFVFYRNLEVFQNHFTNKIIEFCFSGLPVLHNLDQRFSVNGKDISFGYSLNEISCSAFLKIINENSHSFPVKDFEIIKEASSIVFFRETIRKLAC